MPDCFYNFYVYWWYENLDVHKENNLCQNKPDTLVKWFQIVILSSVNFNRIYSMKKTAVYILIPSISLILYFAIYSATSTVYFSANILSCYTDDMDDVLILLYVLPVCVNTTFHAAIFIFAIRKRRQNEFKCNSFEHNVNSKMFRNALTLFVITAMNFVCCFLFFSVMNIQMNPVIICHSDAQFTNLSDHFVTSYSHQYNIFPGIRGYHLQKKT
jgi:hypothetical protein